MNAEKVTGDVLCVSREGTPFRSIRTAFATACRRAGLKDVTPHVLRHTFASRLVMARGAGAGRLVIVGVGAAVQSPDARTQGRCGRADLRPSIPDAFHDARRAAYTSRQPTSRNHWAPP